MTEQRAVLAALSAIMAEVGSVKKDGTNQFHNYKYATAADVMHKLQPLMAKNGLTILQHQRKIDFIQDGAAMAIEYEFHVLHSSGDKLDLAAVHTGVAAAKTSKGSPDDKAANKCHTAARKYFLLSLFQIPTGDYDDADADGEVPTDTRTKASSKAENAASKAATDQKQASTRPTAEAKFFVIDGEGTEHGVLTGPLYLKAVLHYFKEATNKAGFWESNEAKFNEYHEQEAKVGGKPANKDFTSTRDTIVSLISGASNLAAA